MDNVLGINAFELERVLERDPAFLKVRLKQLCQPILPIPALTKRSGVVVWLLVTYHLTHPPARRPRCPKVEGDQSQGQSDSPVVAHDAFAFVGDSSHNCDDPNCGDASHTKAA